jgi:Fur family ferric uptake transcriptional regulator
MAKEYKSKYKAWMQAFFRDNPDRRYSAQEVFGRMSESGMKINLATVYRNLERLCDDEFLQGQKLPEEEEMYYRFLQPGMGCTEHLHLYCAKCGKVIHLNCEFMDEISHHLMKEHGFSIDCGESMLVGLCRECRAATERLKMRPAT